LAILAASEHALPERLVRLNAAKRHSLSSSMAFDEGPRRIAMS
jgi:hypothetical protein